AVADILPDIAFMHWPRDVHSDHEVASQLSKVALRHGDRLLSSEAADKWYGPARIYQYDNGPWHTEGFEPDTYYDVSDVWVESTEWIGKLMALVQNKTYDPKIVDPAVKVREVLLAYRGAACGIDYAEAFRAGNAYAQDIL
ncbi:MAG: hypothetical protein HRT89_16570, partial [Lentisphaeria bacterium]|nr:hypothetical protein [Lentisphaeria bacterium]